MHDDRVDAVYDGPQPNRGQQIDDVLSGDMTTIGMARHSLPWPPHPGQGQFTNLSEKGFAPVKVPPLAVGSEREHISRTKMVGVVPNIKSSQSSTGSTKQTSVPTPRTSPLCLIVEDSASDCSSSGEDGAGGSNLGTKTGPRGNVGDTDLTHAKDSRHDAPEEDTDERTTRRDGTPGDLAILEPGMEDIPAGYKSPQDHNNPSKKRGRTPGNQFNAVGDEPNSKRARNTTSASGDQTSAADIEADQAQGAATPAPGTIVDEENPEKQGKSKNKSTAKSNPKLATPTMKDKLEALSASNPPNPDSQSITTRKSARTPLNETAQDSDKTPVRTPARRRQRQIVGDYGDVPLEPSEIIPGSSVVAQPVTDKPTKRGRKKVGKPYETIQEDEQLEGYEIVP